MPSALQAQEWSAITAAAAAVIALFMNYLAIRQQTKAGDSTLCFSMSEQYRERTDALLASVGTDNEKAAFTEFMHFLETLATTFVSGLLPNAARSIAKGLLVEAIALIRVTQSIHDFLFQSGTSHRTYRHLLSFERKHRRLIERQIALLEHPQRYEPLTVAPDALPRGMVRKAPAEATQR